MLSDNIIYAKYIIYSQNYFSFLLFRLVLKLLKMKIERERLDFVPLVSNLIVAIGYKKIV